MSHEVTYSNVQGNTYTLQLINKLDVQSHCTAYLDYIELANNTIMSPLEKEDLVRTMKSVVKSSSGYQVMKDGVTYGFVYLKQVSAKNHHLVVLHTYDVDPDPIPKILLIDLVYNHFNVLRYIPKDIYTRQNISLLDPLSHVYFGKELTSSVKMHIPHWDGSMLTFLELE